MSNNKKQFLQKKVTIGDVEYTFQKLPTKKALEIKQKWLDQNNNVIELTMCEQLLEHVVVNPKRSVDDYDDVSELMTVCTQAANFQYGGKFSKNM